MKDFRKAKNWADDQLTTRTLFMVTFILMGIIRLALMSMPTDVYAQLPEDQQSIGLEIQPSIAVIELEAGESVRGRIGVGKTIDQPVPIFNQVSKYSPPSTEYSNYERDLWDASEWIKLDKSPIIIEADELRHLEFDVEVPVDAKHGTYFATILFQPVMPPSFFLPESARVIPYIGSLLVINVLSDDSSTIPPEIVEFRYVDSNAEEKQYFDTALSNNDNFYQELSGVVAIRSVLGKEIAEIKVPKTRLLPGETEALQLIASSRIKPGIYTAQMDLISDRGINSESIFFFSIGDGIDPMVMVLTLLTILTALGILIYRYTIYRRPKGSRQKINGGIHT